MEHGILAEQSVLVVDDSRHFISIMRSILRGLGVSEIAEASSGPDALEILQQTPADVAFIDIKMPMIDGFELVKFIRQSPQGAVRSMPVIMMSSEATPALLKQAICAGAEEYLVKPISPARVLARLTSLLTKPRRYIRTPDGYAGPDRRRGMTGRYNGVERRVADLAHIMGSGDEVLL